jgi:hypothetical protein
MSDVDRTATRYIDAWNTTDESERRRAVTELFSRDARYVDPLGEATGHEEICGLIGAVQGQFPGFAFRLLDGADGHHDLLRFRWELGPQGEQAPIVGFDAVVTDQDGRITTVLGFLDRVPAQAA